MGFKFESKYSHEEQKKCVQQCLEGKSKDELSKIYNISRRTIDRWINKICSKEQKEEFKRRVVIPKEKEAEIMKILSCNAILYGFNVSIWNAGTVQKLLKNNYNIEITRYKAKKLIEDSKKIHSQNEDKNINEIAELENLNYKVILLEFIKIGKIERIKVQDAYYERFNEDTLNVNLGIARASKKAYICLIYSERDIITYDLKAFEKLNDIKKKEVMLIQDDKISFIKKVIEIEGDISKVVFVCKRDIFMKRFKKSNEKPLFYIVNTNDGLTKEKYETDESDSLVQNIKCEAEQYSEFESTKEIFDFLREEIQKCNKEEVIMSILKYL